MSQAQKIPLVSYTDLAKTKPKMPAITTPITPLGIPIKCGIPNKKAEIKNTVVGVIKPFKGETIPIL